METNEDDNMTKYIGITGLAGSGKDTLAEMLESLLGTLCGDYDNTCEIHHLARPLKDSIGALLDIPSSVLDDRKVKESVEPISGLTYRHILQLFGTEFVRTYLGENFWTELLQKKVSQRDYLKYVIVPDVRFPNEAKFIKDNGGLLIKIVRPDNPHAIDLNHDSEKCVNEIIADTIVSNYLGKASVLRQAEIIAKELLNE